MCNLSTSFTLCTCGKGSSWLLSDSSVFIWELHYKTVKQKHALIGEVMGKDLDKLEAQQEAEILQQLNARNCFDFLYTPKKGDSLSIYRKDNIAKQFNYIFESGQWKIGGYDSFRYTLQLLHTGIVK